MPDKTINPDQLRQDIIKTLKEAITSYAGTVKEIRQRELKKTELCLLCGNADGPATCTCLRKDDSAAMDMANGIGGGGPMAMAEKKKFKKDEPSSQKDLCSWCDNKGTHSEAWPHMKGERPGKNLACGDHLHHLSDAATPIKMTKDELHEADGPTVQGARAVPDKKEPGAVLPGDKDPAKDNQPDEGSGGMKKDEMLAGQKAPAKAGKTVADLRARANHHETNNALAEVKGLPGNSANNMAAMSGHVAKVNKPGIASMGKKEKPMSKSGMVPSVQDKVNAVVGNQDPGDVPQNVKDALKPDEKKDKKDDKKKPVEGSKDKKMAKVSVDEANKEMSGFKSVAGKPMPGMGTKVANPQAMSPGKGPKPVAGSITAKNEDRLQSVLGKCAMCSSKEHMGKCETV